ncbi:iron ABC transporter permease [Methanofollis formosanus]|uniref:Cobalamin import system permease protein BtuC n=1 Tax=Methanofollis formosanus TaxID=299308 RepID=A0A8G1EGT4_9EURY|nr:iron ABC transporter permease [Methanofollis formosanus]QYZ80158.1 iron ABC transporter permease [Methanofollis formosanus]
MNETDLAQVRADYTGYIKRKWLLVAVSLFILITLAGFAANLGSYDLSLMEVYSIIASGLFSEPTTAEECAILVNRLPRIVFAMIAGFGLAVAGTVMQAILKNPLASPFTLGIASAAGLGASIAFILGAGIGSGMYLVIGNAFVFTLIASAAVFGLASIRGLTPGSMIMAGIAIMYLFSAMTSFVQYFSDADNLQQVVFWMLGSLDKANWDIITATGVILLVSLPYLFWKAIDLNVMGAGDESARSMGVNVKRVRIACLSLTSLITAGIICFTGTIGFIGLVAPHITRMMVGGDHRFLLPASGLLGAVLLLAADTAARTVIPGQVMPVGVMTAFFGVPFFLYLFIRRGSGDW